MCEDLSLTQKDLKTLNVKERIWKSLNCILFVECVDVHRLCDFGIFVMLKRVYGERERERKIEREDL